MASTQPPCAVCSGKVVFSCSCVKPRVYFCNAHLMLHKRTPGNHAIRTEDWISKSSRANRDNPENFLIETVGWMLEKAEKEHARMSDLMHQQYCDCTASIYQIFEIKIVELNEAYEGLKNTLRRLKEQADRQESSSEMAAFLIVAAHVREATAPFLDVTKEANLRISFSSNNSPTDTRLESIYAHWDLSPCGCDRCFELAAVYAHKTQSEVIPQTPGCRHYPSEKTYKVYKCCRRQYFCWKCHDEWEKHARLELEREVCVKCGQEIRRGKCEWCAQQGGLP